MDRSDSDQDHCALLALHRGDLSPAVQYLRDWIDRIKTAEPCAALSTFYAVADLLIYSTARPMPIIASS